MVSSEELKLANTDVLKRSTSQTNRTNGADKKAVLAVRAALQSMGRDSELSDHPRLMAVGIPPDVE